MQLLERDAVLAALQEYAQDARAGDGRVVLIAGEAGVGKTAVVEQLHERIPGARWLWGACEGSFTPRPLGPVYDVAHQVGGPLQEACDVDASRQRIFRALLDAITADDLTVLCLEDVHWADEATLDLLGYLAPRVRHAHVMLIVTYRDDGLAPDHPLRMTLGELGTQTSTRRIDLPPLSRTTVTALAREGGVAADELFELTAGNPFLVTEVLEAGTQDVPPSVRDAVLARAARLSADARAALDACAVIGNRIDVVLLKKVAGTDMAGIDGCLTAGALVSDASGFRFRHEIARRAVEEALPAHRREELNQRVLDELVDCGVEDAARLAHYADAAGDGKAVLRFAPVAARQAASLGAHREAATQYKRALPYAEDARARAELLTALGAECALIDHWADAEDAQLEALALWQQLGDKRRTGDLQRQMARTMWRLCRGDIALTFARDAVETLEPLGPSVELGWAYAVHGIFVAAGAREQAVAILDKAKAIAEEHGAMSLLANVLNSLGCIQPGVDGADDLRRSLSIGQEIADDAEVGRAFTNLQSILASQYHLAEAEEVFVDGMSYCADHDIGTYEHCLRGSQGQVLSRLGRWDEADELLKFDLAERELSPINKISKLVVVGELDARRGRATAAASLDEAMTYAEAGFERAYILEAGIARIEAAWLAGDAEAIRHEAARAIPVVDTHDEWYAGALATWVRRCGLPDIEVARIAGPYQLMLAGDWRAAADAWHELGAPYEEALALLDSGDSEAMQEAVRIFEKLGATATIARAQAILRQHGVASIPRGRRAETRANRFGLTRREQEVLGLIGEGLTNAEIGARLFIAEKTVDNHVSSVLAKMNVESRREAARLAAIQTAI